MYDKEKIVKGILDLAGRKFPNSEIYLFGSQANETAKKISDWDILILLDSDNVPLSKEIAIMDDFYDLELQAGAVISPIVYSKSYWNKTRRSTLLYEKISNDAVRIK